MISHLLLFTAGLASSDYYQPCYDGMNNGGFYPEKMLKVEDSKCIETPLDGDAEECKQACYDLHACWGFNVNSPTSCTLLSECTGLHFNDHNVIPAVEGITDAWYNGCSTGAGCSEAYEYSRFDYEEAGCEKVVVTKVNKGTIMNGAWMELGEWDIDDQSDCQEACFQNHGCYGFSYKSDGNSCELGMNCSVGPFDSWANYIIQDQEYSYGGGTRCVIVDEEDTTSSSTEEDIELATSSSSTEEDIELATTEASDSSDDATTAAKKGCCCKDLRGDMEGLKERIEELAILVNQK